MVKVIALDPPSEHVIRRLAKGQWTRSTFLTAAADRLNDLSGNPSALVSEIDSADLVIMVAVPGGGAHAASVIGKACSERRVTTTVLVIGGASAPEAAVSKTLSQVRPWSLMTAIADSEEYLDFMLLALRA